MKNPTILKDELRLLTADRSAVITELRNSGLELKQLYTTIAEEEYRLEDVRNTISEDKTRLDYVKDRVKSVSDELARYTQDLNNIYRTWEATRVKNSQEQNIHLGRIKELKKKEEEMLDRVNDLKKKYDNNEAVYTHHSYEKKSTLRLIDDEVTLKTKELGELSTKLKRDIEEEKKITKERLKREDKIREREKSLEIKELVQKKKEEDLITMSKDIVIVYGRLKEHYAKVYPTIDLDKLILKAI